MDIAYYINLLQEEFDAQLKAQEKSFSVYDDPVMFYHYAEAAAKDSQADEETCMIQGCHSWCQLMKTKMLLQLGRTSEAAALLPEILSDHEREKCVRDIAYVMLLRDDFGNAEAFVSANAPGAIALHYADRAYVRFCMKNELIAAYDDLIRFPMAEDAGCNWHDGRFRQGCEPDKNDFRRKMIRALLEQGKTEEAIILGKHIGFHRVILEAGLFLVLNGGDEDGCELIIREGCFFEPFILNLLQIGKINLAGIMTRKIMPGKRRQDFLRTFEYNFPKGIRAAASKLVVQWENPETGEINYNLLQTIELEPENEIGMAHHELDQLLAYSALFNADGYFTKEKHYYTPTEPAELKTNYNQKSIFWYSGKKVTNNETQSTLHDFYTAMQREDFVYCTMLANQFEVNIREDGFIHPEKAQAKATMLLLTGRAAEAAVFTEPLNAWYMKNKNWRCETDARMLRLMVLPLLRDGRIDEAWKMKDRISRFSHRVYYLMDIICISAWYAKQTGAEFLPEWLDIFYGNTRINDPACIARCLEVVAPGPDYSGIRNLH